MNFKNGAVCFTFLVGLVCASHKGLLSSLMLACKSKNIGRIKFMLALHVATPFPKTDLPINMKIIKNSVEERNMVVQNAFLEDFEHEKREQAALKLGLIDSYLSLSGSSVYDLKNLAIETKNVAMLTALTLTRSAPFTITDLFRAVKKGDEELIKLILLVSPTINDIVSKAFDSSNSNVISHLFGLGDVIYFDNEEILQLKATSEQLNDIKHLIKNDQNSMYGMKKYFHQGDANDELALWAAEHGRLNIIKYLVERGANFRATKALQLSAQCGHSEIVKYLDEKGASIHADNEFALRMSARNGFFEIVKYFVQRGADIHAMNDYALR